jgi:hypothetical protein
MKRIDERYHAAAASQRVGAQISSATRNEALGNDISIIPGASEISRSMTPGLGANALLRQ